MIFEEGFLEGIRMLISPKKKFNSRLINKRGNQNLKKAPRCTRARLEARDGKPPKNPVLRGTIYIVSIYGHVQLGLP